MWNLIYDLSFFFAHVTSRNVLSIMRWVVVSIAHEVSTMRVTGYCPKIVYVLLLEVFQNKPSGKTVSIGRRGSKKNGFMFTLHSGS